MTARSTAAERFAARIAELERRDRALARASQLAHSTVDIDGTAVAVPDALTQGVQAGAIAEQVRADLDAARETLDANLAELDTRLDEAETRGDDADGRIAEAEGRINSAFDAAEQAQLDAAAALAAAEAAVGANAVVDPGLENPSMWADRLATAGSRFSIVTSDAHSGGHALRAVEGAEEAVLTLGTIPVRVGMFYRFRLWMKTPSGFTSSAQRPALEFYDQNGALLATSVVTSSAATGEWAQYSSTRGVYDQDASVTAITMKLRVRHTAARTILLDDFELVDYTDAQELAIALSGQLQAKPDVLYRTTTPTTGNYGAAGSTWFQVDSAGNVLAQFQQTAATLGDPPVYGNIWEPVELTSEVIANLDVGKLTAGSAQINDVVAQRIAAASGQFIELDVSQLTASEASFDEAVADKLWSDEVVTRLATAQQIIAGEALIDGAVTADKIAANTITAEQIAANSITAGEIAADALTVGTLDVGRLGPSLRPTIAASVPGDWVAENFVLDGTPPTVTWPVRDGAKVAHIESPASAAGDRAYFYSSVKIPILQATGTIHVTAAATLVDRNGAAASGYVSGGYRMRPVVIYWDATGISGRSGATTGIRGWQRVESVSAGDLLDIFVDDDVPISPPVGCNAISIGVEFSGVRHTAFELTSLDMRQSEAALFVSNSAVSSPAVGAGRLQASYGEIGDLTATVGSMEELSVARFLTTERLLLSDGQPGAATITREDVERWNSQAQRTYDWDNIQLPGFYWASGASTSGQPINGSTLVHAGYTYFGQASGSTVMWQEVRYGGNNQSVVWRRYQQASGNYSPWVSDGPDTGTYNAGTNITAGSFYDQTITFSAGKFSSAPKVVAGTNQVRILAACTSKSATQATIRVFNVSTGTATGTCTVDWTATA